MLKQKSQVFKIKFHLAKLQATNNKVNSKVHAYLMIENQQLQFKDTPQLKKNIAVFGSDLYYENFMIGCDDVTGLYQAKKVLLVIEFQTQGTYIKIGEVIIDMGQILNEKKYRVVNVYELAKCYDKSARVKLAVDFIPTNSKINLNTKKLNQTEGLKQSLGQKRQEQQSFSANDQASNNIVGSAFYKNPTGAIKSRLAEQQNVILQERIYDYEKKIDNYRKSQNQLSQRMQQQLQLKDQKVNSLSLELSKQQNGLHLAKLQNQSLKNQVKQLKEQLQNSKHEVKSSLKQLEQSKKSLQLKEKQFQAAQKSIENLNKSKESKEKHLVSEIQKYTVKYSQSQQEKNKIVFQLQSKLKQQLQRKDQYYHQIIKTSQKKHFDNIKTIKDRNTYLEEQYSAIEELNNQQQNKISCLELELHNVKLSSAQQQDQNTYLTQTIAAQKKQKEILCHELQSITFSYQQTVNQLQEKLQNEKQLTKKLELTKSELLLSNQTIEEQRQKIIVMTKELQVNHQRQYYMEERYNQQLYDHKINNHTMIQQKIQLQSQLKRATELLRISQDKLQQVQNSNQLFQSTIQNLQKQLTAKNSILMKISQQKLCHETQSRNQRQVINELQEEIVKLQQQKQYLKQNLVQTRINIQNNKSQQWNYKIESLQNDIQVMIDRFKSQKETLKDHYKKEQNKKNQQIDKLLIVNKKVTEEVEEFKIKLAKKEFQISNLQKTLKEQSDKVQQLQRQLFTNKQTYRQLLNQKEVTDQTLKQIARQKEALQREIDQLLQLRQKSIKDLSQIKTGFNRLISLILQQTLKRYNQAAIFQQISQQLADTEIVSYVNMGLKKFCDEHNKTRQIIKTLQEFKKSKSEMGDKNFLRKENVEEQENMINQKGEEKDKYKKESLSRHNEDNLQFLRKYNQKVAVQTRNSVQGLNNQPQQLSRQLQQKRHEIDRYKKQQSQYKVKIKQLEEQVEKQQRLNDNAKFDFDRIKSDLEDVRDQLTRINFTLRKKDKIIKELQTELEDAQKLNLDHKTHQPINLHKPKEKTPQMQSTVHLVDNPSLPLIRDLQLKLNLKSQELNYVQNEVESLRQHYLLELNSVKKLQSKLKEKSQRIISLQKEIQSRNSNKSDQKQKQNLKLLKILQKQSQEKQEFLQKINSLQQTIKQQQMKFQEIQHKNYQLQQQLKFSEIQFKRNLQSNQYLLNDKSTVYETDIIQLRSEISQQKEKCSQLTQKNLQLTSILNKKSQELQAIKEKLFYKEKELIKLEEQYDEEKSKMTIKCGTLRDRIRELQNIVQIKEYQLQQCKFTYEGRVLELQRQVQDFRDNLVRVGEINQR